MKPNKQIALLTTVNQGGTMQFTIEMYKRLKELGETVVCIIPQKSVFNKAEVDRKDVVFFERDGYHNVLKGVYSEISECNHDVKSIAKRILDNHYDCVITTDTASLSLKIVQFLKKKQNAPMCIVTIHDAINHPSYTRSLKDKFYAWSRLLYREKCLASADMYLFLSEWNRCIFKKSYPKILNASYVLPLGAHLPDCVEIIPKELVNLQRPYYLFFGRLEKYKGIKTILSAFIKANTNFNFIIAGNGFLTKEENELIENHENIILLKRFIDDGEMKWLIKNAVAVTLPYIEASQSGVIPICYFYGVPVITSNIEGLTQFVLDEKTGFICNTIDDYVVALNKLKNSIVKGNMSACALQYYNDVLDWNKNLTRFVYFLNDKIGEYYGYNCKSK